MARIRCSLSLVFRSVLLTVLALTPALARSQPSPLDRPSEFSNAAFDLAEKKFRAHELQEAEQLYLQALQARDHGWHSRCYDQLLTIYARLGRYDRALQMADRYQPLLEEQNDWTRIRQLNLRRGELLLGLGHIRTAERWLEEALGSPRGKPLSPAHALTARMCLARAAEMRGDRGRAGRFWGEVEELAREQAVQPRLPLSPRQRIECLCMLADSYRFQEQHEKALAPLEMLLTLYDELRDPHGRCETLQRLAGHHAARGKHAAAEQCLRQALTLIEKTEPADRLLQGDLAGDLADLLQSRKQPAEAEKLRTEAAGHYLAVLEDPRKGQRSEDAPFSFRPRETSPGLTAFWKLQQLYQRTSQYRLALQLTASQAEQWPEGLLAPRLKSEQGSLQALLGAYARARPLLRQAVARLEQESPPNLRELPRVLCHLALVEQVTQELDRSESLAKQCLELYRKYDRPDDPVLVEAWTLLGTCSTLRGDFAQAIDRFREGAARAEKVGAPADRQQSNLLLNLALLFKAQGELPEAVRACSQARAVYRRLPESTPLGLTALDAAQASLLVAQGQLSAASELAVGILEVCRQQQIDRGPLLITALHCRALHRLQARELDAAEKDWQQVRELQQAEKQTLLLPRTLNYLALTAEVRGRLDEAEQLYQQAFQLQQGSQRASPTTHFITLWRLAGVLDRRGSHSSARRLLEQAIEVVEAARLRTYGDAQQRAQFFGQFAPAFEQLVDWCIRDGDIEGALTASARGRSWALLDQLQLARVDPRTSLPEPQGQKLRRQEEELRRRLNALRGRAQALALEGPDEEQVKRLLAEFDQAQQAYADTWREILHASPVYRNLALDDAAAKVRALRQQAVGPRTLLLVYHLGRDNASLLLLGGKSKPETFPLTIPAQASLLAPPEPASVADTLPGGRGMILKARPKPAEAPQQGADAPRSPGPVVPLRLEDARALVESYRQQIVDRDFSPSRGFTLRARSPEKSIPVQRLELPGNVFLPPEVRRRIREEAPERLLIVPDGPLHKLPLEALLTEAGPKPRYLLDELPPIIYAPSVGALLLLAARPAPAAGPLSLLTVGDPAYPQDALETVAARTATGLVGLRGQLPRLPFTAAESKRIRTFFDAERVTALEEAEARETPVVQAMSGKRVIHLATHGFADERFGNLFGALALTPPRKGETEDDGFLSLHEIYRLPLQDCELAVLSACMTNVGPQRPLEAGVTLASGFLTAGARRVVASHWSVDDRSTAELMGVFFEGVTTAARKGERVPYAQALQQARRQVRNKPEWSAPYFWAPFVLLGPDD